MSDVFISYSRKDIAFARVLYDDLKAKGLDIWIDWQDIPPVAPWLDEVYQAIEEADTLVVLVSHTSVYSENCRLEIAHAEEHNKRMAPIVLEDVDPKALPPSVADLNWIFFREQDDFQQSFDKLLKAIETDREWVRAHTRLLVRAREWDNKGRDNSFLLRGRDLREAEEWQAQAAGKEPEPTSLHAEYIQAGVELQELERVERERRRKWIIRGLVVGLVVISVFALLALRQCDVALDAEATAVAEAHERATEVARRATAQAQAEEERRIAQARQLAAQSQIVLDNSSTGLVQSVLLAVESLRRYPSLEAEQALRGGLDLFPRTIARMEHEGRGSTVAFSPDGRWVALGSWDGMARVWEAVTGQEVARMVHEGTVIAVTFSPDGRWVASASYDGTARVWEAATGQEVARMVHEGTVMAVTFSPDGRWVASASYDGTARVWEAATGQEVARMVHEATVMAVTFSPDGRWVASRSGDGMGRVWEAATGQEVARMEREHNGSVSAMAFSPDGRWVTWGGMDGTVHVWEAATGQEVARMEREHNGSVSAMAFSPDGRWVVSGGGNTVQVWEAATGEEVARMVHGNWVSVLALSPDGQWVASGEGYLMFGVRPATVRVWEVATGQEIARMTHGEGVAAVTFSPDGQWVASGSNDRTARVWLWKPEDLIAEACSRLTRNLTLEEWRTYLGDEPYRRTCPNLPGPEGWEEAPQATPSPAPSPTPTPTPHSLLSPSPALTPTVAVYPSPTLTEPAYPFISPLATPD